MDAIIQNRRGDYSEVIPENLRPGEYVIVQQNDPNSDSGQSVYVGIKQGVVKRLAFSNEVGDYNIQAQEAAEQAQSAQSATATMVGQVNTKYNEINTLAGQVSTNAQTAQTAAQTATTKADEASQSKTDAQTASQTSVKVLGSMAPAYDATKTYAVGDLVIYDNKLYQCNTAITTPEAWNANHWTASTVEDQITDLKEDLNFQNSIPDGTDLNSYITNGRYNFNSNIQILNFPEKALRETGKTLTTGLFEVYIYDPGYVMQTITLSRGSIFTRLRFTNGTWNPWRGDHLRYDIEQSLTDEEKEVARSNIGIDSIGLSSEEKNAILECFENVAWSGTNGKAILNVLKNLWSEALPSYANLSYPNGDILIKDNHHLIKNSSDSTLGDETTNWFKTISISGKFDDTSTISFNGMYGINIKGYSSVIFTYETDDHNESHDVAIVIVRIENGQFYVQSMGNHQYSGDVIDISRFKDGDYYLMANMRLVSNPVTVVNMSITLQK